MQGAIIHLLQRRNRSAERCLIATSQVWGTNLITENRRSCSKLTLPLLGCLDFNSKSGYGTGPFSSASGFHPDCLALSPTASLPGVIFVFPLFPGGNDNLPIQLSHFFLSFVPMLLIVRLLLLFFAYSFIDLFLDVSHFNCKWFLFYVLLWEPWLKSLHVCV